MEVPSDEGFPHGSDLAIATERAWEDDFTGQGRGGCGPVINEMDIRTFYRLLGHEKETEVRLLDLSGNTSARSVFVGSEDEFVEVCNENNGQLKVCAGIHERCAGGTKGSDVVAVKTIVIDIDAVRPETDIPATDEELAAAEDVTDAIIEDSKEQGFVPPMKVCSGNGYHLYFCICDIPVTDENREAVGEALKEFNRNIARRYKRSSVQIDIVGDLARIMQIPGTMNIKGSHSEERPHRLSRFVSPVDADAPRKEDRKLHDTLRAHITSGVVSGASATRERSRKREDVCGFTNTVMDEKEILAKLEHITRYNSKAKALMEGDTTGYDSRSEAELALVVILVRDGIRSKDEIDAAMRLSKIGKWGEEPGASYRDLTYRKAVEFVEQIEGWVTIPVVETSVKVRRTGSSVDVVIFSSDGSKVSLQPPKTVLTNIKRAAKFLQQNLLVEDKDEAVREARRFINEYNTRSKEFETKWKSLGMQWSAEEILKDGQHIPFTLAQDVNDGMMSYGLSIPVRVPADGSGSKGGTIVTSKTIVVSGKGELLTVEELEARGYFVRPMSKDISAPRWSEKGIRHFIATKGKAHVDTRKLYDTINARFKEYIDLQDGRQHILLTLWTMGTYVFQVFSTYPYVYLMGYKESGKSKILDLVSCMAFNPVHSTNCTTASLFREIHYNRATLLLDEMEGLQPGSRWERTSGVRHILNSGYKKGVFVPRTGGEDYDRMDRFEIYSPKMIASIDHPDHVLGSRCIRIIMLPVEAASVRGATGIRFDDPRWQDIRDELYAWGLHVTSRLVDVALGAQGYYLKIKSVRPRMKELWTPILQLAELVGPDVLEEMITYCKECNEQARIEELEEALEMTVLKAVIELHKGQDNHYPLREILVCLRAHMDGEPDNGITSKKLGQMMRKLGFSRTRHIDGRTQFFISRVQIDDTCKRHGVKGGELSFVKNEVAPGGAGTTSTKSTSDYDEEHEVGGRGNG